MENRLEAMRPDHIDKSAFTKAMLCVGATENHGPHLPFATDTWTVEGIAEHIARQFDDMLLLPAIPYGVSESHMDFSYTLSVSADTMIALLRDVLESLYIRGMRRVVIVNGHNGNTAAIEVASRSIKVRHKDMVIAAMPAWWLALGALLPPGTLSAENGWHSGEAETAIALALFEEHVDMSLARPTPQILKLHPLMEMKYSFDEITRIGSGGHPERATREKGDAILSAVADAAAEYIRYLDGIDWDYCQPPQED